MPMSVPPLAARFALGLALLISGLGLAPTASAATVTVHIGVALDPNAITVTPGTAVRWVNESANRYRMRSRSGPEEFDSGNLEPGESFTFVFRLVGTYDYVDDRERDDPAFHGTVAVRAAGDAGPTTPPSGPGSSAPPPAGQPALPTSVTVHMAGERFSPSTVTIAAGGRVTFLNDDDREHTATATAGAFDTGVLGEGGSAAASFPTAGTFAYLCAIHPEMTGTVTVRAAVGTGPTAPVSTPPPVATPRPSPTPAPDATAGDAAGATATPPPPGVGGGGATDVQPPATPAAGVADGLGRTIVAAALVVAAVLVFGWLLRGTMRPPQAVLRRR